MQPAIFTPYTLSLFVKHFLNDANYDVYTSVYNWDSFIWPEARPNLEKLSNLKI